MGRYNTSSMKIEVYAVGSSTKKAYIVQQVYLADFRHQQMISYITS
ncbi:hypothetical protein [Aquimarina hainanensis]